MPPQSLLPKVSIIIVSWNGEKYIKQCLSSIFKQKTNFKFEVIVVDNNSRDKTQTIIQNDFPQIILQLNKKNLGFAVANNQGIKKSRGNFVLLLNQDIELLPDSLAKMVKILEVKQKEKIVALAPQLLYPNKTIQKSLRPFPTPLNVLWDFLSIGRFHKRYYNHSSSQVVEQPMASCLLITNKTLKLIKGFDESEKLFLFFNDVDLSFRIHLKGLKHFFSKEIQVIHHHGKSTARILKRKKIEHWCNGLSYFLKKHYAKKNIFYSWFIWIEVKIICLSRILLKK